MAVVRVLRPILSQRSQLFSAISKWPGISGSQRALYATSSLSTRVGPSQNTDLPEVKPRRPEPAEADTLMDIGIRNVFNEDHDILRRSIRRFVKDEITPRHRGWQLRGYPDREVFKQMSQAGLSCLSLATEHYGQGGTLLDASILWDEFFYANAEVGNCLGILYDIIVPYLVYCGTQQQREKYLKGIAQDGLIGALGMTEPDAGSDLQGIKTTAKQDGDDWIINGSKMFITNGYNCDFCLVVAKTSSEAKSAAHGISLFLVDADTPGFTKGKPLKKLGLAASDTSPLYFDDVRVPKSALLGEVHRGFGYMMRMLPMERLGTGSAFVALAEFMFEETRNYVRERTAFGKYLSNFQVIQHRLAEMKTLICVSRSFSDQCLQAAVDGHLDHHTASMSKLWSTDMALKVGSDCVQLHGGTGYMEESEIARAFAWARVGTIYAGTNEIMKELISRNIVKDP